MSKFIIIILLLSISPERSLSQDNKIALDYLNSMSDKYKKMKGFTSSFTYSMQNLTENITDSFDGTISVKDEKYVLSIEGQKIINDSKTVWTYIEELNEVTISNFDPSEQEISINNVFEVYKEGFTYKFIGTENDINKIEIYPDDENKSYYKISFDIFTNDLLSSFTVYDKSNSVYIYLIKDFKEEDLENSLFLFDESKHPGIEVIDFR